MHIFKLREFRLLALLLLALFIADAGVCEAQTGQTLHRLRALQQAQIVPVVDWRFHQPDVAGGEKNSLLDADWQSVQPGFHWKGENTRAWFRTRITIPEAIEGFPTKGFPVRLRVGVDADGEIYVDGQLRQKFHWDDGNTTLTEHARPRQTFVVAIRGINGAADGELRYCRLNYGLLDAWQPHFDRLLLETGVLEPLASRNDVIERLDPVLFARIRAHIAAGRWEPTQAMSSICCFPCKFRRVGCA